MKYVKDEKYSGVDQLATIGTVGASNVYGRVYSLRQLAHKEQGHQ